MDDMYAEYQICVRSLLSSYTVILHLPSYIILSEFLLLIVIKTMLMGKVYVFNGNSINLL